MKISDRRVYACIFCGSKNLTREHVIPRWMTPYLDLSGVKPTHWVSKNGGEPGAGKMHRPGDYFSQSLRVVCKSCNTGWMSTLQQEAKPHLIPLLHDDWSHTSRNAVDSIAKWITMATMVREFDDPPTASIPNRHRQLFAEKQYLSDDLYVFLGRYNPGLEHSGYSNHFGMQWLELRPDTGDTKSYFFQSTTATIKSLLYCAISLSRNEVLTFDADDFAERHDLRLIHPLSSFKEIVRPITAHDWLSRQIVSDELARKFGIESFRSMPRSSA